MMPLGNRQDFEDLEASHLYCPACKRAMPVRKRLLLGLLDRETFDYVPGDLRTRCSTTSRTE